MITFFQFPIADLRCFVAGNTGKLLKPGWPSPSPYAQFMRSFGGVVVRDRGGISGWIGENEICNGKRVFRFVDDLKYELKDTHFVLRTRCSNKYFYHDIYATGKFEVGFVCPAKQRRDPLSLSSANLSNYLYKISNSAIVFKPKPFADRQYKLIDIGKPFSKLYLYSSSNTKIYPSVKENDWIVSMPPIVVCEIGSAENVGIPDDFLSVPIPDQIGVSLYHGWINLGSKIVQSWIIKENPNADFQKAYILRLFLLRLNAEYEVLRIVLQNIEAQKIDLNNTNVSDQVQKYLNEITTKIFKAEQLVSSRYANEKIGQIVCACIEYANPGIESSSLSRLQNANIRPQVYKKAEDMVNSITIGRIEMSTYNIDHNTGNINIGNIMNNVSQIIGSANHIDQNMKAELEDLVNQLKTEIEKVPAENKEAADAVAETTKSLVEIGTNPKPNKTLVQITADGLKKAAENIASVVPTILPIAASIVKTILQITGVPVS